jgi:imidazoleglycerol-phosphate dehydratase
MSKEAPGVRYAEVERETLETRITVALDFDGQRQAGRRLAESINTGVGFLDHMLELMAFHGSMHVGVTAEGDLRVDDHHTVEDVGIVIGQAIQQALAGSIQIERYGSSLTPMDEALAQIAIDISGRGQLYWNVTWKGEMLGRMATQNVREFFEAVARHGRLTLHIRALAGENDHHVCEAIFKGFGRALRDAARITDSRPRTSTKGKTD